jgi:hypothetical protein
VVNNVAFSPDGRFLATAEMGEGTIRVWDAAGGQELACARGIQHTLDKMGFTPDGRTIVARAWNRTLWSCDVATGTCTPLAGPCPAEVSGIPEAGAVQIRESEVAFLVPVTGQEIAWFPGGLLRLTADGTRCLWAGSHSTRLYLFCREGRGW